MAGDTDGQGKEDWEGWEGTDGERSVGVIIIINTSVRFFVLFLFCPSVPSSPQLTQPPGFPVAVVVSCVVGTVHVPFETVP